ncbi:glycosyltransferase family 9 protein [Xenorhabdus sp. XENO-10]|uniref:Glycosyltransferase family 9 protein n=1 Tax=Xenorhabdus yunnanensis TaxID=3025878 RepID=A0ABT5LF60_9GAMM|nr:glycosyltransferase family 9 protein [Xenorhabdus yunnanensis]MDC9589625.1 glycosyltransferase family 9 protein [Xenorhabdus yunnanensis]
MQAALTFRRKEFDIAISTKPTPMKLSNLFLWLLGAKKRYAVVTDKQWHSKLINYPMKQEQVKGYHQALKVLRTFSPIENKLFPEFFPCIKFENVTQAAEHQSPRVLFSVSNNRKNSLINNENLTLIANKILDNYPETKFIISSYKQNIPLAEDLRARIGKNSEVVISDSLNSFLALLNSMTLIIVGDGGICHLAAALQKKLIAFYGVTTPENWAPLATEDKCITFYDPDDVNNIDLDTVYPAILFLLKN